MKSIPVKALGLDELDLFRDFVREHYRPNHVLTDPAFLRWQFVTPWEEGPSGLFAVRGKGGRILAEDGGVACELSARGRLLRGRMSMNLMSSRQARGFGFGMSVVQHIQQISEATLAVALTADALQLHVGLGFVPFPALDRYLFVPDGARIAPLLRPGQSCASFAMPPVAPRGEEHAGVLDDRFTRLFDATVGRARYGVRRSARYLAWRYREMPYHRYRILVDCDDAGELVGVLIWRVDITEPTGLPAARLVDLYGHEASCRGLVAHLVRLLSRERIAFADAFFASARDGAALLANGFRPAVGELERLVPHWTHPLEHSNNDLAYRLNAAVYVSDASSDEWKNRQHWYLTKSDSDQDRPTSI